MPLAQTANASAIDRVSRYLLPLVRVRDRVASPSSLAEEMRRHRVAAVSVAALADDRVSWACAWGVLSAGAQQAANAETLFQAASISKPVAALVALRLVDERILDLDADVNCWLRSWRVGLNAVTSARPVTLRSLLSHTSGLGVEWFPGYQSDEKIPSLHDILSGHSPSKTPALVVEFSPETRYRYSSGGIAVLEQLLVDATGSEFPALAEELVFRPLGMARSWFEQPLAPAHQANAAAGHGHDGRPLPGRWRVYPELAAAGLWTTPSDLCRFMLELQAARGGRGKVLTAELGREMLMPHAPSPFGLGILLEGGARAPRFSQGGVNAGFRARMVGSVDPGFGAVVMSNGDGGALLPAEIITAIAMAAAWPDFLEPERVVTPITPRRQRQLVGRYRVCDLAFAIQLRDGKLLLRYDGDRVTHVILPESESLFFCIDEPWSLEFDEPRQPPAFVRLRLGAVIDLVAERVADA